MGFKFKLDRTNWVWFLVFGLSALALSGFQALQTIQRPSIRFLDVGQGDAILIRTPEFHTILVDAGPGSVVVDQLGKAMGFFDKTIDLFVLSHPDRDHFAGILDVFQKYKIDRILMTGVTSPDSMYEDFLAQAKANDVQIEFANADRDVQIGPDLYLDVLYPLKGQNLVGQMPSDKNDTSTMVRLVQKGGICGNCAICGNCGINNSKQKTDNYHSIAILTGDAEFQEESEVLAAGEDVSADILKLGHHGSKYSTSVGFLDAINPKIAVVSAGAGNKYGHPAPETLEKVKKLVVRRTDKEGTITFNF
jgi:competence protein ComEC